MRKGVFVTLLVLVVSACATFTVSEESPTPAVLPESTAVLAPSPETIDTPGNLTTVRLPVGYIPDVQFAPLYVGIEKGFFEEQGLAIVLDYNNEIDSVQLVAADELQFAVVSGEQILLGRAQGLPVVYVTNWFNQFPVGIASLSEKGIRMPSDLRGRSIGTPVLHGASYIGLVALLKQAGLSELDVTLDSIGYAQVEALTTGMDDAVVIYSNNEPVKLAKMGYEVDVIRVSEYYNMVGNGLITNERTLSEQPDLVRRMSAGFVKAIAYTINHPEEAFEICHHFVESLSQADQETQYAILLESIELWKSERIGFSDPQAWQNMHDILVEMSLLASPMDLDQAYSNEFLP